MPPFPVKSNSDYVFLEDAIPNIFVCTMCSRVFRDPQLMTCCGKKYCYSCVMTFYQAKPRPKCSNCNKPCFRYLPDLDMRKTIDGFRVKCINHRHGCNWEGELGSMKAHLLTDECSDVQIGRTEKGSKNTSSTRRARSGSSSSVRSTSCARASQKQKTNRDSLSSRSASGRRNNPHQKSKSVKKLSPQPVANEGSRRDTGIRDYSSQPTCRDFCDQRLFKNGYCQ